MLANICDIRRSAVDLQCAGERNRQSDRGLQYMLLSHCAGLSRNISVHNTYMIHICMVALLPASSPECLQAVMLHLGQVAFQGQWSCIEVVLGVSKQGAVTAPACQHRNVQLSFLLGFQPCKRCVILCLLSLLIPVVHLQMGVYVASSPVFA